MFRPPETLTLGSYSDQKVDFFAPEREFSADVAIEDWDLLLNAVTVRLRAIVADAALSSVPQDKECAFDRIRSSVTDCIGALDQLQVTIAHELERNSRFAVSRSSGVPSARSRNGNIVPALQGISKESAECQSFKRRPGADKNLFFKCLVRALGDSHSSGKCGVVLRIKVCAQDLPDYAHDNEAVEARIALIGARLSRTVRTEDSVGRIGRAEFACLLTDCAIEKEQLSLRARTLLQVVTEPASDLRKSPGSVSIGIAMWPADGASVGAIMTSAREAMLRAESAKSLIEFY